MNKTAKQPANIKRILLISIIMVLFMVHVGMLLIAGQQVNSLKMLQNQLKIIENDQRVVTAASTLMEQYAKELSLVSQVFPNDKSFLSFMDTFEKLLKTYAQEQSVKFNATQPLPEDAKLFLPLTVSLRFSDMNKLYDLLKQLESWTYMTHITGISINSPDGIGGPIDAKITIKIYVKTPFITQ